MTEIEMCTDACAPDLTETTGDELDNASASAILRAITTVCEMICSFDSIPPISQGRAEIIHSLADSVNLLTNSISHFGYEDGDDHRE